MRVLTEEYIMARLKLSNHDIAMDKVMFTDILVETFQVHYRAIPTIDEPVLRPRIAVRRSSLRRARPRPSTFPMT
jgi:hypothetical protein